MNPIDLVLWYINFLMDHIVIIAFIGLAYAACETYTFYKETKQHRHGRHLAVQAYADQFGVTYAEADRLVITDHLK